jgi:hypothetical protein
MLGQSVRLSVRMKQLREAVLGSLMEIYRHIPNLVIGLVI